MGWWLSLRGDEKQRELVVYGEAVLEESRVRQVGMHSKAIIITVCRFSSAVASCFLYHLMDLSDRGSSIVNRGRGRGRFDFVSCITKPGLEDFGVDPREMNQGGFD